MWTDAEQAFLQTQRLGRLATIGSSGPQVRPVGFHIHGDVIDSGGTHLSRTQKWRNVHTDDRVALVIDDLGNSAEFTPRGVEIRGHAELVRDGRELIRIRPARIISWGLDGSPFAPTSRPATR